MIQALPADKNTKQETLITATPDFGHYWRESWNFRELLWLLAWRDVAVRYKQTVFGVGWAVIRPFLTMVVFTLVFGRLAKLPSHNVPYALLVFSGVLPWQFFASAFADAGNSLVANANMVAKVYFPRIILPASSTLAGLVDLGLAGLIYALLSIWYGFAPGWQVLFLPVFVALLFAFVLACALWVSALNVAYRDFRYVVPFVIQLGTYVSPVGFSSSVIPEKWQLVYALNPMVGIIGGIRWSLLGGAAPLGWQSVALSSVLTFALFVPGIHYFRKLERGFADVI